MMSDYPVVILGISSSQYITQTSNYAHVRSSRYLQKLVMSAEHSPSHVRSLTQENGAPLTVSAHYADKNIVNIREPWPGLSDGSLSWEKPAPPGPSSRSTDTPFAQFTPMGRRLMNSDIHNVHAIKCSSRPTCNVLLLLLLNVTLLSIFFMNMTVIYYWNPLTTDNFSEKIPLRSVPPSIKCLCGLASPGKMCPHTPSKIQSPGQLEIPHGLDWGWYYFFILS